jgi:ABC-type antimicrobial peptide transport system permease subunit
VRVHFHDNDVGPGYFRTLSIPILAGREFLASDRKGAPEVAILNENLARRLFGDRNPVGRTFRYSSASAGAPITVVGIAANSKYFTLGEEMPMAMYMPYAQGAVGHLALQLLVRTAQPESLVRDLARRLGPLDPSAAIEVKPMRSALGFALLPSRVGAALLGAAALLGLALASIGLYGVLVYSVTRRTREIGLRMALGAQRTRVIGQFLREGMALGATGIALGLVIALAVGSVLEGLVFGISTRDASTMALVAVLLGAVTFVACAIPARRAARVDPAISLRNE